MKKRQVPDQVRDDEPARSLRAFEPSCDTFYLTPHPVRYALPGVSHPPHFTLAHRACRAHVSRLVPERNAFGVREIRSTGLA